MPTMLACVGAISLPFTSVYFGLSTLNYNNTDRFHTDINSQLNYSAASLRVIDDVEGQSFEIGVSWLVS